MSTYSPGRPPNERDIILSLNGCPTYLGALVSTGAAVNNLTTATPFLSAPLSSNSLNGTLAGRVLLIQTTAAGVLLPSCGAAITIAAQATMPPLAGTFPGVLVAANTSQIIIMRPDCGWLQWMPSTGSANLLLWELT
jgi:hypothetical protein